MAQSGGMDEREFLSLAEECLEQVAEWLETFDPDELDYGTTDGVVQFEFPSGLRFVLNRQTAASQMWFAAGARAWHYNWQDEDRTWRGDRDGHDLLTNITRVVGETLGHGVDKIS